MIDKVLGATKMGSPIRWRYLLAVGLVVLSLMITLVGPTVSVQAAMDSDEQAFLTLINNYRQQNGLGALAVSPTLTSSAEWMSQDMASKNYFSHTDSLGRDPFQRMSAFGYSYGTYKGENLAAGNAGAQATFSQWQSSPGHNANMLNGNYRVIGIGRASGGTYGWYWTTDFGGYNDSGSIAPQPSPTPPPPPPAPAPVPSPIGDRQAPMVFITSPMQGATVSGVTNVNVWASDNVGVARVELWGDGTLMGTDTSVPFTFSVDSARVPNGKHTLVARAFDAAGNVGTSGATSVYVSNAGTPLPAPMPSPSPAPSPAPGASVPGAPTGLHAVGGSKSITLTWWAPAGAAGYNVYRVQGGGWKQIGSTTATTFTDTGADIGGLRPGLPYYYAVAAYNSVGTGPKSMPAIGMIMLFGR